MAARTIDAWAGRLCCVDFPRGPRVCRSQKSHSVQAAPLLVFVHVDQRRHIFRGEKSKWEGRQGRAPKGGLGDERLHGTLAGPEVGSNRSLNRAVWMCTRLT